MDQACGDAFALYQRCISSGVVEYLQQQTQMKMRRSVYSAQVVIWLMIRQWLQPKGTLATTVEALLGRSGRRLAERLWRASGNSGFRGARVDTVTHGRGCRSDSVGE